MPNSILREPLFSLINHSIIQNTFTQDELGQFSG